MAPLSFFRLLPSSSSSSRKDPRTRDEAIRTRALATGEEEGEEEEVKGQPGEGDGGQNSRGSSCHTDDSTDFAHFESALLSSSSSSMKFSSSRLPSRDSFSSSSHLRNSPKKEESSRVSIEGKRKTSDSRGCALLPNTSSSSSSSSLTSRLFKRGLSLSSSSSAVGSNLDKASSSHALPHHPSLDAEDDKREEGEEEEIEREREMKKTGSHPPSHSNSSSGIRGLRAPRGSFLRKKSKSRKEASSSSSQDLTLIPSQHENHSQQKMKNSVKSSPSSPTSSSSTPTMTASLKSSSSSSRSTTVLKSRASSIGLSHTTTTLPSRSSISSSSSSPPHPPPSPPCSNTHAIQQVKSRISGKKGIEKGKEEEIGEKDSSLMPTSSPPIGSTTAPASSGRKATSTVRSTSSSSSRRSKAGGTHSSSSSSSRSSSSRSSSVKKKKKLSSTSTTSPEASLATHASPSSTKGLVKGSGAVPAAIASSSSLKGMTSPRVGEDAKTKAGKKTSTGGAKVKAKKEDVSKESQAVVSGDISGKNVLQKTSSANVPSSSSSDALNLSLFACRVMDVTSPVSSPCLDEASSAGMEERRRKKREETEEGEETSVGVEPMDLFLSQSVVRGTGEHKREEKEESLAGLQTEEDLQEDSTAPSFSHDSSSHGHSETLSSSYSASSGSRRSATQKGEGRSLHSALIAPIASPRHRLPKDSLPAVVSSSSSSSLVREREEKLKNEEEEGELEENFASSQCPHASRLIPSHVSPPDLSSSSSYYEDSSLANTRHYLSTFPGEEEAEDGEKERSQYRINVEEEEGAVEDHHEGQEDENHRSLYSTIYGASSLVIFENADTAGSPCSAAGGGATRPLASSSSCYEYPSSMGGVTSTAQAFEIDEEEGGGGDEAHGGEMDQHPGREEKEEEGEIEREEEEDHEDEEAELAAPLPASLDEGEGVGQEVEEIQEEKNVEEEEEEREGGDGDSGSGAVRVEIEEVYDVDENYHEEEQEGHSTPSVCTAEMSDATTRATDGASSPTLATLPTYIEETPEPGEDQHPPCPHSSSSSSSSSSRKPYIESSSCPSGAIGDEEVEENQEEEEEIVSHETANEASQDLPISSEPRSSPPPPVRCPECSLHLRENELPDHLFAHALDALQARAAQRDLQQGKKRPQATRPNHSSSSSSQQANSSLDISSSSGGRTSPLHSSSSTTQVSQEHHHSISTPSEDRRISSSLAPASRSEEEGERQRGNVHETSTPNVRPSLDSSSLSPGVEPHRGAGAVEREQEEEDAELSSSSASLESLPSVHHSSEVRETAREGGRGGEDERNVACRTGRTSEDFVEDLERGENSRHSSDQPSRVSGDERRLSRTESGLPARKRRNVEGHTTTTAAASAVSFSRSGSGSGDRRRVEEGGRGDGDEDEANRRLSSKSSTEGSGRSSSRQTSGGGVREARGGGTTQRGFRGVRGATTTMVTSANQANQPNRSPRYRLLERTPSSSSSSKSAPSSQASLTRPSGYTSSLASGSATARRNLHHANTAGRTTGGALTARPGVGGSGGQGRGSLTSSTSSGSSSSNSNSSSSHTSGANSAVLRRALSMRATVGGGGSSSGHSLSRGHSFSASLGGAGGGVTTPRYMEATAASLSRRSSCRTAGRFNPGTTGGGDGLSAGMNDGDTGAGGGREDASYSSQQSSHQGFLSSRATPTGPSSSELRRSGSSSLVRGVGGAMTARAASSGMRGGLPSSSGSSLPHGSFSRIPSASLSSSCGSTLPSSRLSYRATIGGSASSHHRTRTSLRFQEERRLACGTAAANRAAAAAAASSAGGDAGARSMTTEEGEDGDLSASTLHHESPTTTTRRLLASHSSETTEGDQNGGDPHMMDDSSSALPSLSRRSTGIPFSRGPSFLESVDTSSLPSSPLATNHPASFSFSSSTSFGGGRRRSGSLHLAHTDSTSGLLHRREGVVGGEGISSSSSSSGTTRSSLGRGRMMPPVPLLPLSSLSSHYARNTAAAGATRLPHATSSSDTEGGETNVRPARLVRSSSTRVHRTCSSSSSGTGSRGGGALGDTSSRLIVGGGISSARPLVEDDDRGGSHERSSGGDDSEDEDYGDEAGGRQGHHRHAGDSSSTLSRRGPRVTGTSSSHELRRVDSSASISAGVRPATRISGSHLYTSRRSLGSSGGFAATPSASSSSSSSSHHLIRAGSHENLATRTGWVPTWGQTLIDMGLVPAPSRPSASASSSSFNPFRSSAELARSPTNAYASSSGSQHPHHNDGETDPRAHSTQRGDSEEGNGGVSRNRSVSTTTTSTTTAGGGTSSMMSFSSSTSLASSSSFAMTRTAQSASVSSPRRLGYSRSSSVLGYNRSQSRSTGGQGNLGSTTGGVYGHSSSSSAIPAGRSSYHLSSSLSSSRGTSYYSRGNTAGAALSRSTIGSSGSHGGYYHSSSARYPYTSDDAGHDAHARDGSSSSSLSYRPSYSSSSSNPLFGGRSTIHHHSQHGSNSSSSYSASRSIGRSSFGGGGERGERGSHSNSSGGGAGAFNRNDGGPWSQLPPGSPSMRARRSHTQRGGGEEEIDARAVEAHHQRMQQQEEERRGQMLQVLIDLLPTSQFNSERSANLSDEAKKCSICFEDYEHDDEQRRLPCTHVFHKDCIDMWLRRSFVCPICKHDLRSSFE